MDSKTYMMRTYHAHTAADAYLVGFLRNGLVYGLLMKELPVEWLRLTRASSKRGGAEKLRIYIPAKVKDELAETAVVMGKESDLYADERYNKGDNFEKLVVEKLTGVKWFKNKTPFTVAGDFQLLGKEIQVKFDGAELTNMKTLRNLVGA